MRMLTRFAVIAVVTLSGFLASITCSTAWIRRHYRKPRDKYVSDAVPTAIIVSGTIGSFLLAVFRPWRRCR